MVSCMGVLWGCTLRMFHTRPFPFLALYPSSFQLSLSLSSLSRHDVFELGGVALPSFSFVSDLFRVPATNFHFHWSHTVMWYVGHEQSDGRSLWLLFACFSHT